MSLGEESTIYTADELAQAIGVSQRTFYSYLSQGFIPEGRRVGRQVVYSTLHLHYGLLIRALVEGGLGLEGVRQILGRLLPSHVQTFAAPLTVLSEARSRLQRELANATRQLRPADPELDLKDMRLEDPVALQARISAWESQLQSLGRQIEAAFGAVRERVLADKGENTLSLPSDGQLQLAALRTDVQELTATVRDLALILAGQLLQDKVAKNTARAAAERLHSASKTSSEAQ